MADKHDWKDLLKEQGEVFKQGGKLAKEHYQDSGLRKKIDQSLKKVAGTFVQGEDTSQEENTSTPEAVEDSIVFFDPKTGASVPVSIEDLYSLFLANSEADGDAVSEDSKKLPEEDSTQEKPLIVEEEVEAPKKKAEPRKRKAPAKGATPTTQKDEDPQKN